MFRTKFSELNRLEAAAGGLTHGPERMQQLEEELGGLLAIADETIRQALHPPGEVKYQATKPNFSRLVSAFGVATLLLGIGWSGAHYYYQLRVSDQIETQLQPYLSFCGKPLKCFTPMSRHGAKPAPTCKVNSMPYTMKSRRERG